MNRPLTYSVSAYLRTACMSIAMVIGLLLVGPYWALSQYSTPYTQVMLNKYAVNPAYAGLDFSLSVTAAYRSQWNGIEGNPETVYLGAHLPFYIWKGSIGLQLQRRQRGVISMNSFEASYNYIQEMGQGLLSIGGRVGGTLMNIDGAKIITPDGTYDVGISHNDPILPISDDLGLGPRWELGIYYYTKSIEVGASVIHLPESKAYFENFTIDNNNQYRVYFEYKKDIYEDIKIKPALYVSTDLNVLQTSLSTIVELNGNVFGGVGVRGYDSSSLESLYMIVGTEFNRNYRLSYSYDYSINGLSDGQVASHEIVFNYNLMKPIATGLPPKIIYNPRYL